MQISVFKAWLQAKLGITSERGANLVEYVFLLAFIALIVLIAVQFVGHAASTKFSSAGGELSK